MYLITLTKNIFKPRNIPILLYSLANVVLIFFIFYWIKIFRFLGETNPNYALYNGLIGIGIYCLGAVIFLSPLGELYFRLIYGLKKLEKNPELVYIQTAFNEVYENASKEYEGLPRNIKLYIKNSGVKNAAAIGRKTIFVTSELLSLPINEIQAVLAHELGHLYQGDTVILLLLTTGNVIINIVAGIIKIFLTVFGWLVLFLGDDSFPKRMVTYFVIIITKYVITGIVFLWTLIGLWLRSITSKKTEFETDRFACSIGYGSALASALSRIEQTKENSYKGRSTTILDKALATHPPTGERIERCSLYPA